MNQIQIKYIRNRAEQIFRDKKDKLRDKHTTGRSFTTEDCLTALRNNEFVVLDPKSMDGNYYGSWYGFVKFTGETKPVTNNAAVRQDEEKLKAAFDKLMDELILGDSEQALKLLSDFESL